MKEVLNVRHPYYQAPFPIFRAGPGDEANPFPLLRNGVWPRETGDGMPSQVGDRGPVLRCWAGRMRNNSLVLRCSREES